MTDDEILLLARESGINYAYDSEGEWSGLTDDVITSRHTHKPAPEDEYTIKRTVEILKPFVRAIEQRTLIKQKAKWYLMGAEDERRACAAICDAEMDEWESRDINAVLNNVAAEIRARGEWTPEDTAYRPDGLSQDQLPPVKSYCGGKPNYCEPPPDQLPDTTKMIEPVCVRYWLQETMESGRWVTTDPMSKSKAKMLLSETYRNAFPRGEIVELLEMPVDRGAWDDVPDATKWVDELRGDEPEEQVRQMIEGETRNAKPNQDLCGND